MATRSEDPPINVQDPVIVLTLLSIVLWLATAAWTSRHKSEADDRAGARRYDDSNDDARYDDAGSGRPKYGAARYEEAAARYEETRVDIRPGDDDDYDERPARRSSSRPRNTANRKSDQQVEAQVNPGKCARFGFCEHEAPAIFKLRGDRLDYKTSVPPEQVENAEWAAKICPARAIKISRPGSKMYLPQAEYDLRR